MTEQTVTRGEVREALGVLAEINYAFVAPISDALLYLSRDNLAVRLHAPVLQPWYQHVELLEHALWLIVIRHALAKDRRHHLVGFARRELLVRGAKERLVN